MLIGAAVVVALLALAAAAIAVLTKKKLLSHTAVESAIAAQYAASNVSCNGGKNFTMKNGATFTCTAADNQAFLVTIKSKSDGTYQVVRTSPAPSASATAPTQSAAPPAVSSAPPASSPRTTAATQASQVVACPDHSVIVSVYQEPTFEDPASGLVLEFSLSSSAAMTSCTLYGYPGVDAYFKCPPDCFTATAVHAVRTPRGQFGGLSPASNTPTAVVVSSHQPAFAVVESPGPSSPGVQCYQFDKLVVTPPNTTGSVQLPLNPVFVACDVDVHPVTRHPAGNG